MIYKTIEVRIAVDEDTWAKEYGIAPDEVANDVENYFDPGDISDSLAQTKALGPVASVKSVKVKDSEPTVVVIGQMRWGSGSSLNAAKARFQREGGALKRGYTVLTFNAGTVFHGVDNMGRYSWSGDAPEVKEVPARG